MSKKIMAAFVLMGGLGVAGCDLATGEFDAENFRRGMSPCLDMVLHSKKCMMRG